jgi:hypothetical protein
MKIVDLSILFSIVCAMLSILAYQGGFHRGYAQREKERLSFDERERITRRILARGRNI